MFNWKLILAAAVAIFLWGHGFYEGSEWGFGRGYKKRDKAAQIEITNLKSQCEADKRITMEESRGLQNDLARLNRRITDTKLLYASAPCVPVTFTPSGRYGTGNGKHAGPHAGVAGVALIDYGADAERIRLKLNHCQSFISKVWEQRAPAIR